MRASTSLLQSLRREVPDLRPQLYFKASLTALSHAMEDLILADTDQPLVIANFQRERFYRQEMRRYQKIAQRTDQVYVLAVPEFNFGIAEMPYATIPLDANDDLAQEWHLIIIGQHYAACLVCQEYAAPITATSIDQARQFQGIWTFDRQVSIQAAQLLLEQILVYQPDLSRNIKQAQQHYGLTKLGSEQPNGRVAKPDSRRSATDFNLFTERLVTYLQAHQYKLIRAHRAIATQKQREQLINSMTAAIRRSLNPEDVLAVAVRELGQIFQHYRCLLYRCPLANQPIQIEYEAAPPGCVTLRGEMWSLAAHPLFQAALAQGERAIAIADVSQDMGIRQYPALRHEFQRWQIQSCLLVPIRYHETWLGMLELHHCGTDGYLWRDEDITLVEAIAAQVGVALMQAQAYTHLELVNTRLAALERTQGNLIAIVGHELRTPLATIQVCLESLNDEPDLLTEMQQVMLQMAMTDADRLRQLVQDFLTLSRLEGEAVRWQLEPISLQECLDLALSGLKARQLTEELPQVVLELPTPTPFVQADGEALTQVLSKLLENACKFTEPTGSILIRAQIPNEHLNDHQPVFRTAFDETSSVSTPMLEVPMLEVIVADTGRGIEPSRLETIFDRFYQEEGFLRRTTGGIGLGLAICCRIIEQMGGKIWATSLGRNQGSQFHFTIPIALGILERMS